MITSSTTVVNTAPIMGLNQFEAILKAAGSPAASEAKQIYQAVVKNKIEPAFFLAIAWKESQFATDPKSMVVIHKTKNLGNTRSSRIGVTNIVPTERGNFVSYDTWAQGADDATFRLIDTNFGYAKAGAKTIGEIIPIWAPGSDGNDPAGYVKTVISLMNKWLSGGSNVAAIPTQEEIGYPVRVHWAYDVGPDRPLNSVNKFVVHDTEGTMASDEPELTRNDSKIASCHALIAPSGELVFMVNLNQTAWTPGNDTVARQSINVEMSGFQSKGYTDAQYKSMAAFFRWCVGQGCSIPAEYAARTGRAGLLGHQDVPNPYTPGAFGGASGHTDPGPLFSWDKFISLIKGEASKVDDVIQLNGFTLGHGFKSYFEANGGVKVFGLPLSNEQTNPRTGLTEMCFERMCLEFDPNEKNPDWQVRGKDIGRFYLTNRGF